MVLTVLVWLFVAVDTAILGIWAAHHLNRAREARAVARAHVERSLSALSNQASVAQRAALGNAAYDVMTVLEPSPSLVGPSSDHVVEMLVGGDRWVAIRDGQRYSAREAMHLANACHQTQPHVQFRARRA